MIRNSLSTLSMFNMELKFATYIIIRELVKKEKTHNHAFHWRYMLKINVSYILGRWSDNGSYAFFVTDRSKCIYDHAVTSVIAPQWNLYWKSRICHPHLRNNLYRNMKLWRYNKDNNSVSISQSLNRYADRWWHGHHRLHFSLIINVNI